MYARHTFTVILISAVGAIACGDTLFEDFEQPTFPPTGWTVIDNTSRGPWQSNAFFGDANLTGGDGACADMNSDYYAIAHDTHDTELVSPAIAIPAGAWLLFDHDFRYYNFGLAEVGDVDITIDGGATWQNLASYTEDHRTERVVISLLAYADETAQIRFHYYNSQWDWWWMVDNVRVVATCFGDIDFDGDVDLQDLAQLLAGYGATDGMSYPDGDLDGDGDIDLSDLSAMLAVYGTIC